MQQSSNHIALKLHNCMKEYLDFSTWLTAYHNSSQVSKPSQAKEYIELRRFSTLSAICGDWKLTLISHFSKHSAVLSLNQTLTSITAVFWCLNPLGCNLHQTFGPLKLRDTAKWISHALHLYMCLGGEPYQWHHWISLFPGSSPAICHMLCLLHSVAIIYAKNLGRSPGTKPMIQDCVQSCTNASWL